MVKQNKVMNNQRRKLMALGSIIIVIQLFDIAVHILTNQVEPIRIISNVIIMALILSNVFSIKPLNQTIAYVAVVAYFILNIIFVIRNSIWTENGDLRIVFFLLVISTLLLSILFIRTTHKTINV